MSIHKKLAKVIQTIFRQALRIPRAITNKLMNWLLRSFLVANRRQARLSRAGFVLPTVVMVILVVMLLTTAILFRSFDRTKNVSNMRASQQAVNAALPGIDRAKAKIDALLNNQTTRGTPNDNALNDELIKDKYTLGDENRLQLSYNGEENNNSWRFAVDTDNNGKFDSFTLYSILFRTPDRDANGNDNRQRTPLEARTIPMQQTGRSNPNCPQAVGTSASLTGYQGWYKSGSQLKRSFFAYVATVPITKRNETGLIPAGELGKYENYKGNKSFSALEFQQDKGKVSVANNAILYEDDLDISPGGGLTVNGRIQTNSNLFVTKTTTENDVNLRQVSSNQSCYYEAANGKIIVGGNLASGTITGTATKGDINIDLFEGTKDANDPKQNQPLKAAETSVTDSPPDIAYNTQAYEARINRLVQLAIANDASGTNDPTEVKDGITEAQRNDPTITAAQARQDQLDIYFRERTRRVPFKEVPYRGTDPLLGRIDVTGSGDDLRPTPPEVMYPFDPGNGRTGTNYAELTLNTAGNNLLPSATQFSKQETDTTGKEPFLGDRILVGNNLPQDWLDQNGNWSGLDTEQLINGINWDDPTDQTRTRKSRVTLLSDVADTRRNGFWEKSAQKKPVLASDGVGGLRVVTGAGVYLPPPRTPLTNVSTVVWPDTMPVIPRSAGVAVGSDPPSWLPDNPFTPDVEADFPVDATGKYRPYLQMRATAVYHYTKGNSPIACVSSFYDPTDKYTARNTIDPRLPDVSGLLFDPNQQNRLPRNASKYNSNNGVTYGPPTETEQSVRYLLNYQAQLVYPNGRLVNPLLKQALATIGPRRTPAQQAAVDSTLCALQIIGYRNVAPLTPNPTPSGYPLPHGTIQEVAFLDGRQIKAIDGQDNTATRRVFDTDYAPTGKYDLSVEQRQPLEIRATVLNLDNLRRAATPAAPYTRPEYMLPNSGIIYATRDDGLPDGTQATQPDYSDATDDASDPNGKQILKLSANDFQLDPTRRPNGIMLTNGLSVLRDPSYREEEKGLILASNLPVYIQATPVPPPGLPSLVAGFNLHRNGSGLVEEFNQKLANGASFYNRTSLDPNFACRSNDPRLPAGACNDPDQWRAATVIADAVTLLSHSTDPTKPFSGFKAGYRSDGDYDLRNNEIDNIANADVSTPALELQTPVGSPVTLKLDGPSIEQKRLEQGFWNNNFVTTRNFTDTAYSSGAEVYTPANPSPTTDTVNSSYFNNAVTPVQRRGRFSEYLMEMCSKRVVSDCTANDWYVDPLPVINATGAGTKATTAIGQRFNIRTYPSGTTAQSPTERVLADNPELARLPRRVAFARDDEGRLILSSSKKPIPLGIASSGAGRIACYTYDAAYQIPPRLTGGTAVPTCQPYSSTAIRRAPNALWFATAAPSSPNTVSNYGYDFPLAYMNLPQVNSPLPLLATGLRGTTNQPLLVPVLQLQAPKITPANALPALNDLAQTRYTNWLPRAAGNTTFNLIMAVGDSPSHPAINTTGFSHNGDFNGGVQNLPRFLENWIQRSTFVSPLFNTNISGSFIQIKRSYYATAPFTQLSEGAFPNYLPDRSIFKIYEQGYPTNNTGGKAPYYEIPNRNWGFDVGLLAQVPDLFSNQFVLAPTGKPNEFFREVNRNDEWVQTLLCAKTLDIDGNPTTINAVNADQRPNPFCQSKAAP